MTSLDQYLLNTQDLIDIACMFGSTQRMDKAENFFRKVLDLEPQNPVALANMGGILAQRGELAKARSMCFNALGADPTSPLAHHNLAMMAQRRNDFDEARMFFQATMRYQPNVAAFWMNFAVNAQYRGEWQEAIDHYNTALRINPGDPMCRMSVGMLEMLRGNWVVGMPLYEDRLLIPTSKPWPVDLPIWNSGFDLADMDDRKILVVCEQGVGDAFMFARYGSRLKKFLPSATFNLFVKDNFRALLEKWPGWDGFYSAADVQLPAHDFQVALMSLPYLFRQKDLSWGPQWIADVVAPERVKGIRLKGQRIGICWRGNPKHPNDRFRSMTVENVLSICSADYPKQYEFDCLQADATPEEIGPALNLESVSFPDLDDWEKTASVITACDLVITVDTAVAHLAATLGVETWLMLPANCDFRWQLECDRTPWYPVMRLFRQEKLGEWGPVLERVREELASK